MGLPMVVFTLPVSQERTEFRGPSERELPVEFVLIGAVAAFDLPLVIPPP